MTDLILKIGFIFLWASAFVAAKLGLGDAGPFSMLSIRFAIVAIIFALMVVVFKNSWPQKKEIKHLAIVGVLLHGFYLGGVFYSISKGTPAGIASLIVSIHPILTCFLAVKIIKEKITLEQWIGVFLGMMGVILVIWPRIGGEISLIGLISCIIALSGISYATIHQKKYLHEMDILSGNTFQAFFAAIFFLLLLITIEPFYFDISLKLMIAMTWLTILVSLGAISILMILIRRSKVANTASLFFLAPPVSAILGYIVFNETLSFWGIIGFGIACTGVWLVNKPKNINSL
tara:strand:- start:15 stop:881 length:867 start_codon:yes stop_codon:yes gene_type:complete